MADTDAMLMMRPNPAVASRDGGFHAVDDAGQIDLRDPLPFGDGQVGDEAGREHAGGIDENVDTTQIGNGFRERLFYGGRIADIDRGRVGR